MRVRSKPKTRPGPRDSVITVPGATYSFGNTVFVGPEWSDVPDSLAVQSSGRGDYSWGDYLATDKRLETEGWPIKAPELSSTPAPTAAAGDAPSAAAINSAGVGKGKK